MLFKNIKVGDVSVFSPYHHTIVYHYYFKKENNKIHFLNFFLTPDNLNIVKKWNSQTTNDSTKCNFHLYHKITNGTRELIKLLFKDKKITYSRK